MSGSARPKGREYNPKNYLVGTQTFKVVNLAFTAVVGLSIGLGYYFM